MQTKNISLENGKKEGIIYTTIISMKSWKIKNVVSFIESV